MTIELLDCVISETLRMFPPAVSLDREASCNHTIPSLGITLPKGARVLVSLANVHYDPVNHQEPHTFRPARFLPENRHKLAPCAYLPFGAGIRHCVGMRFALAEAKLALALMVYYFKFNASPQH